MDWNGNNSCIQSKKLEMTKYYNVDSAVDPRVYMSETDVNVIMHHIYIYTLCERVSRGVIFSLSSRRCLL